MGYNEFITGICRKLYEEVSDMPGKNGTGPMGAGAMTGRGFGPCANAGNSPEAVGFGRGPGLGMAFRRGFGRGFRRFSAAEEMTADNRREMLQSRKDTLKSRLSDIDRQLKNL